MKIRWIGQGGYIIKTANTEIIIDPYLSDVVNRVANRPRLFPAPIQPSEIASDAVICTHNHLDHLDIDAIPEMNKALRFITTSEGKEKLAEMGFLNVQAVTAGETVAVGDISITAVYANHTVEAFGLVIRADGETVYISSDTLYDEKLFEVAAYKPDVTFICINGKLGNMNVEEAVTVAKKIGAKVNIPNHYDMFASNSENPLLFTNNISGGLVMEHNKEFSVGELKIKAINKKVEEIGIVPVIKFNNPEKDAEPLAKALTVGGVPIAEVTFRAAGADKAIALMKAACPDMLLGAGTVLTTEQIDKAVAAGASFIVSPGFDAELVAYCKEKNIPIYPGCTTPTDYHVACKFGLEVVKFFPAEQSGGLAKIKAMSAPFPMFKVMPTGGISLKNLAEYISCPTICACGGSYMVTADLIEGGKWDEITDLCKKSREIVEEARKES